MFYGTTRFVSDLIIFVERYGRFHVRILTNMMELSVVVQAALVFMLPPGVQYTLYTLGNSLRINSHMFRTFSFNSFIYVL